MLTGCLTAAADACAATDVELSRVQCSCVMQTERVQVDGSGIPRFSIDEVIDICKGCLAVKGARQQTTEMNQTLLLTN